MSASPASDARPNASSGAGSPVEQDASGVFSPEAKAALENAMGAPQPDARTPADTGLQTESGLPAELIDFDPAWIAVQRQVQAAYGKKPDLNALLLLIGVQETGLTDLRFTKEQKQDLMHVAVCTLLEAEGHYRSLGRDEDGWPHFESLDRLGPMTIQEQEILLKRCVIRYFNAP